MRFAHPQILWLLAATLPLLVWFLSWAWRTKQKLITQFVQSRLLAQLTVGVSRFRQKIRLWLLVAAVAAALLALARPQWGLGSEEVKQRGLDIVVAIDTSRSMLAGDVRPNRLVRAKLAALDLMRISKSDRLGLVAFAGDAFLQCPLTLDEAAFRQSLEALDVGIIPQGGTALTAAIETALTAFKTEGDNYKILVLFTDGEDHESDALQAAKKAAKAGLRIFTVGVGTPSGEILKVTDDKGVTSYIKDSQGNAVKSRLDENLLLEIATETGGSYVPLRATGAIEALYAQGLAPLPKSEVSSRLIRSYRERFQWPLAFATVLLLAEMLLPERKRVEPTERIAGATNAELRKAVATLILLAIPFSATASPASALRQYERGKFKESLDEYERLIEKESEKHPRSEKPTQTVDPGSTNEGRKLLEPYLKDPVALATDPRLHFNAGAAAYKAGNLDDALKHFAVVTTAPDLELQRGAYYNLGNAFYLRGLKSEDTNEKIRQWQTAVELYDDAVKLNSQDADAKFNRDLVGKRLEELKKKKENEQDKNDRSQPSPEAKKAKAAADEAVRKRDYPKALEIMEHQLETDPTTKAYEHYIERLRDITNAQKPAAP